MSKVRLCGVDIDVVFSDPEDWEANGMGRASQLNSRVTTPLAKARGFYGYTEAL